MNEDSSGLEHVCITWPEIVVVMVALSHHTGIGIGSSAKDCGSVSRVFIPFSVNLANL